MNDPRFWFDMHNPWHIVGLVLSLMALNATVYAFYWPRAEEIVSIRKPVIVTSIEPHATEVPLGGIYPVTFHFEKTREDCIDGRVVRTMWNVDTGWNYTVIDIETVKSEKTESAPFYDEIPTRPLDESKLHLMRPGIWTITSSIYYECPRPDGTTWQTEENFTTPIFRVYAPAEEKGAR